MCLLQVVPLILVVAAAGWATSLYVVRVLLNRGCCWPWSFTPRKSGGGCCHQLQRLLKVLRVQQQQQQQRQDPDPSLGPRPWGIFGTVVEHLRNYHRMHDWLLFYFEHRPTIVAPMVFGQINYYTVDTENVRFILKTNFRNFPKGEVFHERMEALLGDGIFNTDGEKWKQQRKTASAEFSLRTLRDFNILVFKEVALKAVAILCEIEPQPDRYLDMQDLFMRMTLESIGKIGFGVDIGALPWQLPLPENAFAKAFDTANEIVTKRFIDPFWKLKRALKVGMEGQLQRNVKILDAFTYGVIAQRRLEIATDKVRQQQQESQSAAQLCEAPKLDIISRFLELSEQQDGSKKIELKTLRDIVLNFVIAGRDTTAVTLSWFVFCLTEQPEVARRLHAELLNFEMRRRPRLQSCCSSESSSSAKGIVCSGNACNDIADDADTVAPPDFQETVGEFSKLLSYDSLKAEELPYLQAALSETLRLYPAVPLDPKAVLEDTVLPDGTHLRKGNLISYSPYCMARMPYIWGRDAKEFKPDRWLRDGKFHPESEFKFATFQAGLRTCLGKDAAYLQLKITAAILCRFFEFHRMQGQHVKYRMMAILSMASGIQARATVRIDDEATLAAAPSPSPAAPELFSS